MRIIKGMNERLTKAFKNAAYTPSANLEESVWRAVIVEESKTARIKLWFFSVLGLVSFAGLLPMLRTLSSGLAQSGFYDYFSLIFSDGRSVITYWKEFAFSLAESLPALDILLSLTLVLVFFLSIKYVMKQVVAREQLSLSFN